MHIAVGIISTEHRIDLRRALRTFYADAPRYNATVRFVVDSTKLGLAPDLLQTDVLAVRVNGSRSHCYHKTVAWVRHALSVPQTDLIIKTNDDVNLNLPRILQLLAAFGLKHSYGSLYGGHIAYSCFRTPLWKGVCFGHGPRRALTLYESTCAADEKPYPFAFGPLIVMGADVARAVAQSPMTPDQTCENEDRIVGHLASRVEHVRVLSFGNFAVRTIPEHGEYATYNPKNSRDALSWRRLPTWNRVSCSAFSEIHSLIPLVQLGSCSTWELCIRRRI